MKIAMINFGIYDWIKLDKYSIKGQVFLDNDIISNIDLLEKLNSFENESQILKYIQKLNGFFSLFFEFDNKLFFFTDKVNTYPIFFSILDSRVIEISNNYMNFSDNKQHLNKMQIINYIHSGYTSNNYTLLQNVLTLQAGEFLKINTSDDSFEIIKYFDYEYKLQDYQNIEYFIKKLNQVHEKVFSRLINSLKNRQVIIPLSGGYDSRLILEYLVKNNYKNIIAVTWGNINDWQVKIARIVSNKLGVKWVFIKQDKLKWRKIYEKHIDKYVQLSGGIDSIPYFQENVTMEIMKESDLMQKDAIVISGNSGDFIEGSHIPNEIFEKDIFNSKEVAELILSKHFKLNEFKHDFLKNKCYDEIIFGLQMPNEMDSTKAAEYFEKWEWRNRQSKFVVNCTKVFELFGHEWRMPFWDSEIMDFWSSVPISLKKNRSLFLQYSKEHMDNTIVKPNPKLNKLTVFRERISDPRYGVFVNSKNFEIYLSKPKRKFNKIFETFLNYKITILHKFNGLIALDVVTRLLSKYNYIDD